jgi:hypothetical protein
MSFSPLMAPREGITRHEREASVEKSIDRMLARD